jgi:hypothetical protein
MDDMMDEFFDDKACDAFVDGLDFEISDEAAKAAMAQASQNPMTPEEKQEFSNGLLTNDDFAYGQIYGDKSAQIVEKQPSYSKAEATNLLFNSSLAE